MLVRSFPALLLAAGSGSAFAPARPSSIPASSTTTTALFSTVEEAPPVKAAPDAGWEPDWEGREGLTSEEFMESDMSKPDLSGMWECPLTKWDSEGCV